MRGAAVAMLGVLVALSVACATAQADVEVSMSRTHVAPGANVTIVASGETGVQLQHVFPIVIVRADRAEQLPACPQIGFCASETAWPIGPRYQRAAQLVFPHAGYQTVTLHAPKEAGRYRLFMAWWRPTQHPGKITLLPVGVACGRSGRSECVTRGGVILTVR